MIHFAGFRDFEPEIYNPGNSQNHILCRIHLFMFSKSADLGFGKQNGNGHSAIDIFLDQPGDEYHAQTQEIRNQSRFY